MAGVPIIAIVFAVIAVASCASIYYYIRKQRQRSRAHRRRERRSNQQDALVTSGAAPGANDSRNHVRFPYFSSNALLSVPASSHRSGTNTNHPYRPQPATVRDHPRPSSPYALPNPTSLSNHSLHVYVDEDEPMVTVKNPSSSSPQLVTGVRRSLSHSAVELSTLARVYLSTSPSNPNKLRDAKAPSSGVASLPRPLGVDNRPYISELNKIHSSRVLNMTRPRPMDAVPPVVIVLKSPNVDPIVSAANALRNPAVASSSTLASTSPPPPPLKNARRISTNAKQQQRVQLNPEAGPSASSSSNTAATNAMDVADDSSENPFLGKEEVLRPPQAILPEGFKQEPHSIPLPTLPSDHREPLNRKLSQRGAKEASSKDQRPSQSPQQPPETVIEMSPPAPAFAQTGGNNDDLYSEELVTTANLVLEPYLMLQAAPPVPSPSPQSTPQVRAKPEPSGSVAKGAVVSPVVPVRRVNSITRPSPQGPAQRYSGQEELVQAVPAPVPTTLPSKFSPSEPSTTWIEAFPLPRAAEPLPSLPGLPSLPSQPKLPSIPHTLPPLEFSPLSSMSEIKTPSPTTLTAQPASFMTTSTTPSTQTKTPPPLPPPRGSRNNSLYSSNSSISTTTTTSTSHNTQSGSSRNSSAQASSTSAPLTIQSRPITPLQNQPSDANMSPTAMGQASPTSAKVTSPKTPGSPWLATGSDGYHNDDREETRGEGGRGQNQSLNDSQQWEQVSESSSKQGTASDSRPQRKKMKGPQAADGAGARLSMFNGVDNEKNI